MIFGIYICHMHPLYMCVSCNWSPSVFITFTFALQGDSGNSGSNGAAGEDGEKVTTDILKIDLLKIWPPLISINVFRQASYCTLS